jgi:hypothetical protein
MLVADHWRGCYTRGGLLCIDLPECLLFLLTISWLVLICVLHELVILGLLVVALVIDELVGVFWRILGLKLFLRVDHILLILLGIRPISV